MTKLLTIIICFFFISPQNVYPSYIQDYKGLSIWLKNNFVYMSDKDSTGKKEYWKTPKETMNDKNGDCEDFAFLANYILTDLHYESYVFVVFAQYFLKESYVHAICVFKDKDQLRYFSNNKLCPYGFNNLEELINSVDANWTYMYRIKLPDLMSNKVYKKDLK